MLEDADTSLNVSDSVGTGTELDAVILVETRVVFK